ncbi:Ig-like domain-containing protein, partial [Flavobacterium koreense]
MFKNSTKYICLFLFTILSFLKPEESFSQCFEIESILVDACSPNNPTNEEGFNEMVRFRVGAANINVSNLNVTWPNNPWLGVVQNATTASKVAALNASITAAGNCGQILEPTGGVLPANATVILVSSYNVNTAFNSFGSLTTTIYMIFQDNAANIGGHFANYNVIPGTRTLTMSFGACTDSVTYERSLLINSLGNYGGTTADNDGATVNFTPTGTPSYANTGCSAPIPPFFTNAGNTITACKGSTINLNGIAQGHQSVLWTAPIGSFSNASNLVSNYTIPANATGTSVTLTLTGTNICNLTTNSTVTINFTVVNPPTVTSPVNYCQNATAVPLIANASAGGTLNWYGTNATGGTASSTAPTPSTTTLGTTTYYVSQTIAGCESIRTPITVTIANTGPSLNLFCDFASPNTTPTSLNFDFSNVGQTNFTYTYSIAGGPPVTGTWVSPSNYTVTGLSPGTSVTFTLTANGVSCVSSMSTTCNTACPSITAPNFAAISPICIGGTVPTLSTTSPNGISGTWSPATISNTASGTYTFTPNSILFPCASNQVLNVSVVNPITPTFNAISPICFGTAAPTLPTTSTNGITGTWSPAVSNTTTTTYTFTPNVGQCATTTTLIITVNPLVVPVFNAIPNVCFGGTINPLPTTSTNGITGTWSPALNNLATTTYTFTPINNQCATSTTLTINVTPNITPTFNTVSPICSGQTLSPLPTTSINGITGTWSPALNNTNTTVYTFTPNTGQCATTTTLTITVNQNITPSFTSVPQICNGDVLAPLPTTSTNGITGTWSPALNNTNTTTYTFTPSTGQCATTTTLTITVNPKVNPTFNQVAPVCSGNTISPLPTTSINGITGTWSPALNNTATTTYTFTPNSSQCANPTTMTISIITTATTPTFNINTTACSGAPISPLPLISQNGISGSWSPAINNTNTTTYTFTPNPGQCASPTTTQISIIGSPIITTPSNYVVCDENNDGESCLFDLTTKNSQISTQVGIQISYHLTPTDAQTGSNPISTTTPYCNITNPQTIHVRVFDPLAPACSSFTSFQLIVTPKPVAGSVNNYNLCDSNPSLTITEAVFNLTGVVTPQVLGTTLPSASHTVTYYTSLADAQVPTNAISAVAALAYTSVTRTLWIRVQNNT